MAKRTFAGLLVLVALLIAGTGVASVRAQEPPPVKPQPPQPDGSIVHEVRQGDTLFAIVVAYKITIDDLKKLNNIEDTTIPLKVGQKLLIKKAPEPTIPPNATFIVVTSGPSPTPTTVTDAQIASTAAATTVSSTTGPSTAAAITEIAPTATLAPSATPTLAPTDIPPTPLPTVAPISNKAAVCVTAFEDSNTNHWRDVDEKPLPGVDLTLVSATGAEQKLATTSNELTCFADVAAGLYTVTGSAPSGYGLTMPGQLEVEVKAGAKLDLQFGAAQGYESATAEAGTPIPSPEPTKVPGATTSRIINTVFGNSGLIVLALAVLVLIGGIGVFAVARSR